MANDNKTLMFVGLAAVGLYLFTRKNGVMTSAGTGGAEPTPTWGALTDRLRSDGTSAVRVPPGDFGMVGGNMPPPLNPPAGAGGPSPLLGPPGYTPLPVRVMGPSDVETFFNGLTTRGFGDVFGGEIRHPLLDGKTPCQAIDAMNNYAAARHPDHPEWRWTTNDIPAPYSMWLCDVPIMLADCSKGPC